jgi:hypothetical protein
MCWISNSEFSQGQALAHRIAAESWSMNDCCDQCLALVPFLATSRTFFTKRDVCFAGWRAEILRFISPG